MILSERINGQIIKNEINKNDSSVKVEYDVIVVGLGTAGAIAAITAAKKGLKVLGIEKLNGVGGTNTMGGIGGYYYGSKGGIYEQIDEKAQQFQEGCYVTASPVVKMYTLEKELIDNKVDMYLDAVFTGVYLEENKVVGIRWFHLGDMKQAFAKVVIDSTADGEVCAMAGCQTTMGRELDKNTQPYSCVTVRMKNDRVYMPFTDCGYMDLTDGKQVSNSIANSPTLEFYSRDDEENDRMLYIAPMLGVREGRHIIGEETITLTDYFDGRITDKPLFYAFSNLDNHGKDVVFESEIHKDWIIGASMWGIGFSVPVPLGALVPKGYDGILTAGRCLAVDHDIAPCVRMNRDMKKCGEAAALIAYVSINENVTLKNVPYDNILPLLKENHCLDEKNNIGTNEIINYDNSLNPSFKWFTNISDIKEGLMSEKPGIAIWSAKLLGDSVAKNLIEWLDVENEHLVKNSAIALALIERDEALPTLRNIIEQRDSFLPKTSKKFNQERAHTAIYLVGKLKDINSVSILIKIISDPKSCEKAIFESNEFISSKEEYYFQYFSQALVALIEIGDKYKEVREQIAEVLKEHIINNDKFNMIITFKGSKVEYSMTDNILKLINNKLIDWNMA